MNVGDFGFFEYQLSQIEEMDEGKIKSISSGSIETHGNDLSYAWFPLSLKNKKISDYFEYYSDKFHESKFHTILNYPDIHRHIVELWVGACSSSTGTGVIAYEDEMKAFFDETIALCEETHTQYVDGVRVIGR